MRGYYRALRDLDREHKQIFGTSISTRSRRIAKRNGTYYDQYSNKEKKKDLRFNQKDTWHELRNPSYQKKYRQSNWKFFGEDQNGNNQKKKQDYKSYNKKYRGNGNINYGKNNRRNPEHEEYRENKGQSVKNSGVRMNSVQQAVMEGNKIKNDRLEKQNEREMMLQKRKKALEEFELQRKKRQKILGMKNRKGQPNLNMQMSLLLQKIEYKKRIQKEKRERELMEAEQQQINDELQNSHGPPLDSMNYGNDKDEDHESDFDVDDFLHD